MEKPEKFIRYASCFTVLLLLFSILPANAIAGSDRAENGAENGKSWKVADSETLNVEENESEEIEEGEDEENSDFEPLQKKELIKQRVQERKELIKQKVQERELLREEIQNQRREYQDAKGDFVKIRNQIRKGQLDPNSPEAMNGTRLYLNTSITYMIAHLEGVKYNLDNSNGNGTEARAAALQERIDQLKEEQEDIENAEDFEEFAIVVKSVRGVWNNAQKDAALGAGKTVSERMDDYLDRSEALSDRFDEKIQELNESGVNTTGLEENLTLYKEFIGYARENHTAAVEIYENESATASDLDTANDYLHTALDNINEANDIVKNIFNELKEYGIETEDDEEVDDEEVDDEEVDDEEVDDEEVDDEEVDDEEESNDQNES